MPRGFTLIELMVTLAVVAILGSLAAPSVRDFIVRSRLTNIGKEFTSSVFKARSDAVNRNTCVTMCVSSNADAAGPACTTSPTELADWQRGWIAFLNPACDSLVNTPDPANVLQARPTGARDYRLLVQKGRMKMTFKARGELYITDLEQFSLIYRSSYDRLTRDYSMNICIDGLGQTWTISANELCGPP